MVFQKLSFWLRDSGIERSTIGFFYWVTLSYTLKFLWAPVIDRVQIPGLHKLLGPRRSWIVTAITGTVIALVIISQTDPSAGLLPVAIGAILLAYSGATLDVAIDAWRIESAPNEMQANMAAAYSLGYRVAYMTSGLGLAIVKHIVNRHRGTLAVASRLNETTKFSVVLPLIHAQTKH